MCHVLRHPNPLSSHFWHTDSTAVRWRHSTVVVLFILLHPRLTFQYDNARPHTAYAAVNCLQDCSTLICPARSPELSPIETFGTIWKGDCNHPKVGTSAGHQPETLSVYITPAVSLHPGQKEAKALLTASFWRGLLYSLVFIEIGQLLLGATIFFYFRVPFKWIICIYIELFSCWIVSIFYTYYPEFLTKWVKNSMYNHGFYCSHPELFPTSKTS